MPSLPMTCATLVPLFVVWHAGPASAPLKWRGPNGAFAGAELVIALRAPTAHAGPAAPRWFLGRQDATTST